MREHLRGRGGHPTDHFIQRESRWIIPQPTTSSCQGIEASTIKALEVIVQFDIDESVTSSLGWKVRETKFNL